MRSAIDNEEANQANEIKIATPLLEPLDLDGVVIAADAHCSPNISLPVI